MAGTPAIVTGFEHGTFSAAGVGLFTAVAAAGGSVIAGAARSGGYGYRSAPTAAASATDLPNQVTSGKATLVGRLYVKFTTFPASNNQVWAITTTAGGDLRLDVSSGGVLDFYWVGTAGGSPGTVTTGVWYQIDFKCDVNGGGTRTATVRVVNDSTGMLVGEVTATRVVAASTALRLRLGSSTSGTWSYDFDDVYVTHGDLTDYPIGKGQVAIAVIDGNGTHESVTNWDTSVDFSSFVDFSSTTETTSPGLLSEIPFDTTDGIRAGTGTPGGDARYTLSDPTPAAARRVNAVSGIVVLREASTGTNNYSCLLELSGNTTQWVSANPAMGTTWHYVSRIVTRPGGGDYALTDVASFLHRFDSSDANPAVWFSAAAYEIDYMVGLAPPPIFPDDRRTPRRRTLNRMVTA